MYTITKKISFCYGHRLMNHPGKCRNLHGHSAIAEIVISSDSLNDQAMVCDFSDIKSAAANFIKSTLDHNFLIHRDDPLVPALEAGNERCLILEEHPTAEVMAKMIFRHMQAEGFSVSRVTLWETDSSSASYTENTP